MRIPRLNFVIHFHKRQIVNIRVQVIASLMCFTSCLAAPEGNSRFLSSVIDSNVANTKVIEASSDESETKVIKEATNVEQLAKEQQSSSKHSTIVNVIALPDEDYRPQEETLPQMPHYHHYYYYFGYLLTPNNNIIPYYFPIWPTMYAPYNY